MVYSRVATGVLVFVFLVVSSKIVNAKDRITWLDFGQIPLYIDSGKYEGKGIVNNIINLIHDSGLPDYSPIFQKVNHKRFDIIAKEDDNCYFGWKTFPNERIFSKPFSIWFPSGILVHKKNKQIFGENNKILSLKDLLERGEATLGVVENFAYQQDVRTQLQQHQNKPYVVPINTQNMQIELSMLSNRPIDYLIGWPFQPIVWEKLKGVTNNFLFYNMIEDQTYLYVGVSCSKTKKGEEVISHINELVGQKEFLDTVQHYIAEWVFLSDQYNQLYQQTIIRGEDSPSVQHMEYQ